MNPGISTVLGTYDAAKTAYPQKSQMLPVGKFRIISESCPNFLNTGQTGGTGGFYYAGRVVQMSAVPKETIQSIILSGVNDTPFNDFVKQPTKITIESSDAETGKSIQEEVDNPNYVQPINRDYLFLFDTENAHDGFCESCT